jgi:hypothetical protein
MTAVSALIAEVCRAGGKLIPDGEGIRVQAPTPLPDDLMVRLRQHKPDLIRELRRPRTVPTDGRWGPDYAARGYVWCLDCAHWKGAACAHPDNPFRSQQPLAPRRCHWFTEVS